MPITVTVRGPRLADTAFSTRELMRELGLLARERIYRRTIGGTDAQDVPFQPYSPAYAALKAKEFGMGGVNLQVSGAMLNAMQIIDIDDHHVTVGFV